MEGNSGDGGPSSSTTKERLLQAACDAAGGTRAFAERLQISEAMLRKYMSGAFEMPDPLLLRAVDLLLEERDAAPDARPAQDGHADA
jgi:hypothetical protein